MAMWAAFVVKRQGDGGKLTLYLSELPLRVSMPKSGREGGCSWDCLIGC